MKKLAKFLNYHLGERTGKILLSNLNQAAKKSKNTTRQFTITELSDKLSSNIQVPIEKKPNVMTTNKYVLNLVTGFLGDIISDNLFIPNGDDFLLCNPDVGEEIPYSKYICDYNNFNCFLGWLNIYKIIDTLFYRGVELTDDEFDRYAVESMGGHIFIDLAIDFYNGVIGNPMVRNFNGWSNAIALYLDGLKDIPYKLKDQINYSKEHYLGLKIHPVGRYTKTNHSIYNTNDRFDICYRNMSLYKHNVGISMKLFDKNRFVESDTKYTDIRKITGKDNSVYMIPEGKFFSDVIHGMGIINFANYQRLFFMYEPNSVL